MAAPATFIGYRELNTGKLEGAQDEVGLCQTLLADFNGQAQNRAAGLVATLIQPTPVRRDEHRPGGLKVKIKYTYFCGVNVNQYPITAGPSAACGDTGRYSYQIGGALPQDNAQCLSCDNQDANPQIEQLVACLQTNIRDIINARAVELRSEDLAPVKAKVAKLLEINRVRPISNLQSLDQISLFMDFLNSK
jgi:hypothetical protein